MMWCRCTKAAETDFISIC